MWQQGYFGKGVVIAILDTGILGSSPDFKTSFRSDLSKSYIDILFMEV